MVNDTSLMCSFNKIDMERTNSLKKLCLSTYVLFYVHVRTGFVDWFEKGFINIWEEFWSVHLLVIEFDCPEVTPRGWVDVKIQLQINFSLEGHSFLLFFFFFFLFFHGELFVWDCLLSHPEMTPCGWQDVKIQLLTVAIFLFLFACSVFPLFFLSFFFYIFFYLRSCFLFLMFFLTFFLYLSFFLFFPFFSLSFFLSFELSVAHSHTGQHAKWTTVYNKPWASLLFCYFSF